MYDQCLFAPLQSIGIMAPPTIQGLPNNNDWLNTYNMLLANVPSNSNGDSGTAVIAVVLIGVCLCCFFILAAEVGGVLYTKYYGDKESSIYKTLFVPSADADTSGDEPAAEES